MLPSSTSEVGVKVAVQVVPLSAVERPVSAPPSTLKSPTERPLTASLKVIVTVVVSPALSDVSESTIDETVGRTPSVSNAADTVVPVPAFPAASATPVFARVIVLPVCETEFDAVNVPT